ncbi:hypothetical protein H4Q26_009633 [Puccinia striiformis f. sp. tritici PST-130]|nr:hypothetical protein H4Q26_009633 [Puccinia striiformis f. sp. tritici PST-130]
MIHAIVTAVSTGPKTYVECPIKQNRGGYSSESLSRAARLNTCSLEAAYDPTLLLPSPNFLSALPSSGGTLFEERAGRPGGTVVPMLF